MIISLFIQSGGGHWAGQGLFAVPAAAQLHTSQAATAMAVTRLVITKLGITIFEVYDALHETRGRAP